MDKKIVEGKNVWGIFVVIVLLLFYSGISPDSKAGAQTSTKKPFLIRWNLDTGPNDTLSLRAEKTKELVEADPQLRDLVKIELYYSGSLLKTTDAIEALIRGDVQMTFVGTWYFEKLAPNIIILDMPFLFKDMNSVNKYFDSPEAEAGIYRALSNKGIKWLAGSPVGTYSILTKDRVKVVEDLKGMKIRTVGNGAHTISAFGAVPISLSAGNIYIGMQRNTIQGADISAISIIDRRLYEVGKYFLNAPIHFTSDFCIANKEWFDSLPEMVQQKLEKYTKEGNQFKRQKTFDKEQEAVKHLMPSNGVTVYTPGAGELKAWKDATRSVRELLSKKIPDTELIKKIESMQQ